MIDLAPLVALVPPARAAADPATDTALEALVTSGFRIGGPTLFMASRVFGRPELYLPSGPILY
jgi:hypothetical protein